MNTKYSHINFLWTDLIVNELIRNGINQFFISPGSRSTPLTIAIAHNKGAKSILHFDERGAGFAALGYGQATGKPAVLVCTSGTASANYFPAVIESSMSRIPMIILTADRPPELRDTGANQTIDQVKMYGNYVRWFKDIACPSIDIMPEYILTTIDQAVYQSKGNLPGAVHLNCMFREPLAPEEKQSDFKSYLSGLSGWAVNDEPYTKYEKPVLFPEPSELEALFNKIKNNNKGIILCGKLNSKKERDAVIKISESFCYPVFADITSGLKSDKSPNLINHDVLFDNEYDGFDLKPGLVIHFGGVMTSKKLNQWLIEIKPDSYIHIDNHPFRQDPSHMVTERFHCDIDFFCDELLHDLDGDGVDIKWFCQFQDKYELTKKKINFKFENESQLSESMITHLVSNHIDSDSSLFIGNSLAIRMMDKYMDPESPVVPIGFNRGASGIDGGIATTMGWSTGLCKPATLLIGDLSFLHDLNSLALLKESDYPVTIVVLNNNGGGIFKHLPISKQKDVFEKYWITPHGMTFEKIAVQFGVVYMNPSTLDEFTERYNFAQKSGKSNLIEVVIK